MARALPAAPFQHAVSSFQRCGLEFVLRTLIISAVVLLINPQVSPIKVQTRAGTDIEVSQSSIVGNIFIGADRAAHNQHKFAVPRTEELSGFYNCHGLVFASRRAAIDDTSQIPRILGEDCYRSVQLTDLLPGDIAVYYDNGNGEAIHSAIIVEVPSAANPLGVITVVSKWGNGREYLHKLNDCTYSTDARIEYYRVTR